MGCSDKHVANMLATRNIVFFMGGVKCVGNNLLHRAIKAINKLRAVLQQTIPQVNCLDKLCFKLNLKGLTLVLTYNILSNVLNIIYLNFQQTFSVGSKI